MRGHGMQLDSATQTVGARFSTAVEYGTHIYAASRYSFEIDLLTS